MARRKSLFGLERRANPFENPAIPLTDAGLLNFFGGEPTDAGVNMSEEISLRISAVWRATTLLAGVVASLPLKVYDYDRNEIDVRCLRNGAGYNTPAELWHTVMMHVLLWGNAYLHKIRNGMGQVVELRIIHPQRVRPDTDAIDADGTGNIRTVKIFQVQAPDSGQWEPFTSYDIMHLMGPSLDGIKGLSRIALARESMAINLAADRLAASLFGNGNLIAGVLEVQRPLHKGEADQIKAAWKKKVSGLRHAHDVPVIDNGMKFTPLALPPEDAQFLQTRQFQVLEVGRWFGVPLHLLNEITKSTTWGSGLEEQNAGLLRYTLQDYLVRFEQRVTAEICGARQFAEFLVDELLRPDMLARYQAYNLAIMSGWMLRNEARLRENMKPLDGLWEPLIPTLAVPSTDPEEIPVEDPGAGSIDDQENEDPLDTEGDE